MTERRLTQRHVALLRLLRAGVDEQKVRSVLGLDESRFQNEISAIRTCLNLTAQDNLMKTCLLIEVNPPATHEELQAAAGAMRGALYEMTAKEADIEVTDDDRLFVFLAEAPEVPFDLREFTIGALDFFASLQSGFAADREIGGWKHDFAKLTRVHLSLADQ